MCTLETKLRPWLQDFDYGGDYGGAEVRLTKYRLLRLWFEFVVFVGPKERVYNRGA